MTSRPRLITSIPFWILLVASLAATAVGLWIALDRLATMETALTSGTATGIEVYVGQPWAVVGGAIAAAGLVGLFLTLTTAAIATILPRPAVDVIETIDWSDDDETAPETDVVTPASFATSASTPGAEPVSEDPDVETPSDAPAPPRVEDETPAQR